MRSGHFEAIWSSLAPLLAKLANCPEGFLGVCVNVLLHDMFMFILRPGRFHPKSTSLTPS